MLRASSNWFPKSGAAATGAVAATIATGTSPSYVCFDGVYVWVSNTGSHNLTKIKASDDSLQTGTYAVPGPRGICFDGTSLWVCSSTSNSVVQMNPSDGTVIGTFAVGEQPEAVCFDGTYIWVANEGANNVTKLNLSGTVIGTYPVQTAPAGIVFDGRYIWVTNSGSNTISPTRLHQRRVDWVLSREQQPNRCLFRWQRDLGSQRNQRQLVLAVEYRPNSFPSHGICHGFGKDGRPTPYHK